MSLEAGVSTYYFYLFVFCSNNILKTASRGELKLGNITVQIFKTTVLALCNAVMSKRIDWLIVMNLFKKIPS